MKCTIPSAKTFYKLLNFIAQFETDVKITCQPAGMGIFSMSSCHSVFIDAKIDPSYYTEYECEEYEEIGLNLTVIIAALKNGGIKDELILQTKKDTIEMDIISEDEVTNYIIKQMNIESEIMEIPQIEENVCINVVPMFFKKWKSKVIDFTKSEVTFTPKKNHLEIKSVDSIFNGTVKVTQVVPSVGINYDKFNGALPVTIGNKILSKAFNIGDVTNEVQIGWKNDMPLRFGAKLTNYSSMNVYIAPKLEMDEGMDED